MALDNRLDMEEPMLNIGRTGDPPPGGGGEPKFDPDSGGPDINKISDPNIMIARPELDVEGITGGYNDVIKDQSTQSTTGTSFQPEYRSGSVKTSVDGIPIATGDSSVSDKSLVQNQLEAILGSDSPLMKQQEAQAQVRASRMGQLGSSMGIAAAQGALINQGLDIAKQDANTFAQAGLTAQQAKNSQALTQTEGVVAGELAGQQAAIQERATALKQQFTAAMQQADQATAAVLQNHQREWDAAIQQMDQEFNQWATKYQVTAQMQENIQARRSEAIMNFQITQQELLGDPAFLEMGEEAVSNLLNTMADGVISTIRYDMLAAGYSSNDPALNTYLDDLADDLYISFDDE